jgi:hypothetical protein
MTPRHLMLAGGLAVAGWFAFFGDKTPASTIAEPMTPRQPASQVSRSSTVKPEQAAPRRASTTTMKSETTPTAKSAAATDILALRPREELIGGARTAETNAMFASQSWAPPPPPPPPPSKSEPQSEAPPAAPPLPFTYLGKKAEDGTWEVYLARGDKTYIVREHSVIDPMYRVDAIKPPTLSVTYMPLNEIQVLTIGDAE